MCLIRLNTFQLIDNFVNDYYLQLSTLNFTYLNANILLMLLIESAPIIHSISKIFFAIIRYTFCDDLLLIYFPVVFKEVSNLKTILSMLFE